MKIAVAGVGYVGLSLAVLFAQHHEVYAVSTTQAKVDKINSGKSPIVDKEIEHFLANKKLNLTATTDKELAYKDAEFVVVATPTNYDPDKNYFDTSAVEDVIRTAVSLGGDCDTLTCIAGSIAEGFYGVPEELKQECRSRLPENLLAVLRRFDERMAQK